MVNLFFELLQIAIGEKSCLSRNPTEKEWEGIYAICQKQAVAAFVFSAIERFNESGQRPPAALLYEWIGLSEQVKAQNALMNKEAARLTILFEKAGHHTAILKGQANARLYHQPWSRQPGDIDIWVDGGEAAVMESLHRLRLIDSCDIRLYEREGKPTKSYHHVHLPTNENGVNVEVHFRPSSGVFNPFVNKQIQSFLEEEIGKGCELTDDGFMVPSLRFALVMQMAHVQRHFMSEGIGLRQLIDYYYLLKSDIRKQKEDLPDTLGHLGLAKMAGAVMWVLNERLGLEEEYLIAPMDERRGKILLNDILRGGNFGKYATDKRLNVIGRLLTGRIRHLKLLRFDWKETIWFELNYWKIQAKKAPLRLKRRSWTV